MNLKSVLSIRLLKFIVQRISTGDYVKDLEARVLVTDNISDKFRNFSSATLAPQMGDSP